jgi:hypothetical protein
MGLTEWIVWDAETLQGSPRDSERRPDEGLPNCKERKEEPVRKLLVLVTVVILILATAGTALAANGPVGPAPNSGDGVSDGSGFDRADVGGGVGPAPNSGDGIPDGSGF